MDPEKKSAAILLVDDEAALTKLMQTYLGRIGYSVDTALNATSALALLSERSRGVQSAGSRLTLPDMSGQDMAVRMVQLNKQLRVLLCSGYPTAVRSAFPLEVQENFDVLQKPFLPNMLADRIEELLNREIG